MKLIANIQKKHLEYFSKAYKPKLSSAAKHTGYITKAIKSDITKTERNIYYKHIYIYILKLIK